MYAILSAIPIIECNQPEEMFMHVMATNGSPRNEKSSTCHILSPLLEGMRAAGANTELVHLGRLKIRSCLGCFL